MALCPNIPCDGSCLPAALVVCNTVLNQVISFQRSRWFSRGIGLQSPALWSPTICFLLSAGIHDAAALLQQSNCLLLFSTEASIPLVRLGYNSKKYFKRRHISFLILFLGYYWNRFTCFSAQKTHWFSHVVRFCSTVSLLCVKHCFSPCLLWLVSSDMPDQALQTTSTEQLNHFLDAKLAAGHTLCKFVTWWCSVMMSQSHRIKRRTTDEMWSPLNVLVWIDFIKTVWMLYIL